VEYWASGPDNLWQGVDDAFRQCHEQEEVSHKEAQKAQNRRADQSILFFELFMPFVV
jgi:predicted oxidoreductase (fatty acid repression mutant protein)